MGCEDGPVDRVASVVSINLYMTGLMFACDENNVNGYLRPGINHVTPADKATTLLPRARCSDDDEDGVSEPFLERFRRRSSRP